MPTETGGETIGERLTRLRSALVRTRETIARAENNGQANNMGGAMVTEISYDRALARERELTAEIATLEARLSGSAARPGIAVTRTVMED
jgi:hypothetical protein